MTPSIPDSVTPGSSFPTFPFGEPCGQISHWEQLATGGRRMRVSGLLEDHNDAAQLLKAPGWHAYATDSQGARAPLPGADPDTPELPFSSELDGIAYELELWEQARRHRFQAYARMRGGHCNQRGQVARVSFVLGAGEWRDGGGLFNQTGGSEGGVGGRQGIAREYL